MSIHSVLGTQVICLMPRAVQVDHINGDSRPFSFTVVQQYDCTSRLLHRTPACDNPSFDRSTSISRSSSMIQVKAVSWGSLY